MPLIKNPDQPCMCRCGLTRGQFIEQLMSGPAKLDVDTAARCWSEQQEAVLIGKFLGAVRR